MNSILDFNDIVIILCAIIIFVGSFAGIILYFWIKSKPKPRGRPRKYRYIFGKKFLIKRGK